MSSLLRWSRLDNAAKIFPPTSSRRNPKVFRFSCEFFHDVDPVPLQAALEQTMEQYPFFRCILKKGVFWYYLEESTLCPVAAPEILPVCSPIYRAGERKLLFRVVYYKKRISLEIFHALADGAGGLYFFRTLILHYLAQRLENADFSRMAAASHDASEEQKVLDAFERYFTREQIARGIDAVSSYRMRGERLPEHRMRIMEVRVPAGMALKKAHQYGTTLGEFVAAVLIWSIYAGMPLGKQSKQVVLTIPVDLRRFFPTGSARNFFGIINAQHCFKTHGRSFEDVLASVRRDFSAELSPERLLGKINRLSALSRNYLAKIVPLFLKIPILKIAGKVADCEDTAAISNLGRISMPTNVDKYIRLFAVGISASRPQICMCSYRDVLTMSICSPLVSTDLERCFCRNLVNMEIPVELVDSMADTQEGDAGDAVL